MKQHLYYQNLIIIFLKILNRLQEESINSLGKEWYKSWDKNLPNWQNTPGGINIPVLLWLANLIDSFDLEEFANLDTNYLVMEVIGFQAIMQI